MTCRKEEEVCLVVWTHHDMVTISVIKDLERESTLSNKKQSACLSDSLTLISLSQKCDFVCVCVFFFLLEFGTLERPHCRSKWPHRDGYTCAPAWISTPESCAHSDPDYPEGAVGREVRVPALLHRVLRGVGERVAIPLPLLSQRRRWAVCRHVHSPLKSPALKMPRCVCL